MIKKLIIEVAPITLSLAPDQILAIKAEGNYSTIILIDGQEILVTKQIGKIEKHIRSQIPEEESLLLKLGRSLIINAQYIFMLDTGRDYGIELRSPDFKTKRSFKPSREKLKELQKVLKVS